MAGPFRNNLAGNAGAQPSSGYPLVTLFLLMTLCGILIGMVMPLGAGVSDGSINGGEVFLAALIAGFVMTILGVMVGIYHHRRVGGIFLGGTVGGLLGLIAGPLCFVPREGFTHLLVVALAGSVLLLTIGTLVRLGMRGGRVEPTADSTTDDRPEGAEP